MTAPLSVLQITDSHLTSPVPSQLSGRALLGVDTAASLAAVLKQALEERTPDAVIASGDLAHDPEADTYRAFLALLRRGFHGPVLYLAGNHDLNAPLTRILGQEDALVLGRWEIIGFDTHVDDQVEASFGARQRAALVTRIERSAAEHVLLACHHHPLPVGCPWLDKDCIPEGREVLESCAAAGGANRVKGLVFGHVHQEVRTAVGGMSVLGTPSTCFQFEPRSQAFTIDRSADTGRPGYRWLTLHDDGTLETELRRVTGYHLNIDMSEVS